MKHFPWYLSECFWSQIFQHGDMPRGAPIHKFVWYLNGVVLWVYVTSKILLHLQKTYEHPPN